MHNPRHYSHSDDDYDEDDDQLYGYAPSPPVIAKAKHRFIKASSPNHPHALRPGLAAGAGIGLSTLFGTISTNHTTGTTNAIPGLWGLSRLQDNWPSDNVSDSTESTKRHQRVTSSSSNITLGVDPYDDSMNRRVDDARNERKILDLEITNKSLMNINANLETKLKQERQKVDVLEHRVKKLAVDQALAERDLLDFDGSKLQFIQSSEDVDPVLNRVCDMVDNLLIQAKHAVLHQPARILGTRVLTPEDIEYERKFDYISLQKRNSGYKSPARSPMSSNFPRTFMDVEETPRRIAARNAAQSSYQLRDDDAQFLFDDERYSDVVDYEEIPPIRMMERRAVTDHIRQSPPRGHQRTASEDRRVVLQQTRAALERPVERPVESPVESPVEPPSPMEPPPEESPVDSPVDESTESILESEPPSQSNTPPPAMIDAHRILHILQELRNLSLHSDPISNGIRSAGPSRTTTPTPPLTSARRPLASQSPARTAPTRKTKSNSFADGVGALIESLQQELFGQVEKDAEKVLATTTKTRKPSKATVDPPAKLERRKTVQMERMPSASTVKKPPRTTVPPVTTPREKKRQTIEVSTLSRKK